MCKNPGVTVSEPANSESFALPQVMARRQALRSPVCSWFLRSGHPSLPVTRLATPMHHSNNKDELRFDGVQNPIGKHPREAATDILFENSPTFWGFQNPPDCVLNGLDEP